MIRSRHTWQLVNRHCRRGAISDVLCFKPFSSSSASVSPPKSPWSIWRGAISDVSPLNSFFSYSGSPPKSRWSTRGIFIRIGSLTAATALSALVISACVYSAYTVEQVQYMTLEFRESARRRRLALAKEPNNPSVPIAIVEAQQPVEDFTRRYILSAVKDPASRACDGPLTSYPIPANTFEEARDMALRFRQLARHRHALPYDSPSMSSYPVAADTFGEVDDRALRFMVSALHHQPLMAPDIPSPSVSFEESVEAFINSLSESPIQDEDPAVLAYDSPFISYLMIVAANAIDTYLNLVSLIEQLVKEYLKPLPDKLLPDAVGHKFTLVLDLNETLVHSDWWDWENLETIRIGPQTFKRPGMDAFLQRVDDCGYEVVLYTDECSLKVNHLYANLEKAKCFWFVETRGSNKSQDGKLYRDLSRLNRDPSRILYVSGHALENCLQPENCVPIKPWKKEVDDTALTDLLPFLEYVANERPDDIRSVLSSFEGKDIATEFIGSKYDRRPVTGSGGHTIGCDE